ncbi:MAG: T9SS type A sorting domain-containing protein [Bacteroidia bacterium]
MLQFRLPFQLISVFLLLLAALHTNAQNINYDWTVASGSATIDDGKGITTDDAKNVYAVGTFTGSVDFDPSATDSILIATGTGSGYLAKYDENGNFLWVFQISSSVVATCNSVCSDLSNNIYIIGEINGISGDFDPDSAVVTISSVGQRDVYVAKYTSSGQFVWLQQFGGTLNEYARKIKAGNNGEIVMSGNFEGTVDFDPGIGTNNITSAGSSDVFIARLRTNGVLDWVKIIGNANANQGPSIGIDGKGGVYSVGGFTGTLDTDPDPVASNFLTATGNSTDGLIIKLDSNGIFQWSHNLSSNSVAVVNDVQPDGDNNIYLTGWFSGFVDFDASAGLDTMTNISGIDVFFWKMDYNGNHIWVKRTGNNIQDFYDGRSVKIDKNGNPFVLGIFEGTADFDPGVGTSNESALGDFDIFVWGLNANGAFSFSKGVGGTGKEVSSDLHIDNADNLYFTGFFTAQVDFNPWAGTNLIAPASASPDFHINKWSNCVPNTSMTTQNICDTFFILNGQTYTSSGTYTQNLTNIGGCDSTITLQLTLTSIDTAVSVSGNVITALQNGASYQWYTCNGSWQPMPNEIQQSFTASQNGQYAVVLTQNGCSDTSACINILGVGINPFIEKPLFNTYPNPSSGFIYFDWNTPNIEATIYIYNHLGQLLQQAVADGEPQTIVHFSQPPGNYIAKIITKNTVSVVPLVMQ